MSSSNIKTISSSQWSTWSSTNCSIAMVHYMFDKFKTSNISSAMLSAIDTDLNGAWNAGMKVGLRFDYDDNVKKTNSDAAYNQLIKHIDQLRPYLQVFNHFKCVLAFRDTLTWFSSHKRDSLALGVNGTILSTTTAKPMATYQPLISKGSVTLLHKLFSTPCHPIAWFSYELQTIKWSITKLYTKKKLDNF